MNFKKVIGASFVGATLLGTVAPAAGAFANNFSATATDAAVKAYTNAQAGDTAVDFVTAANYLQSKDSLDQATTTVNLLNASQLKTLLTSNLNAIKQNMAATIQTMQLHQLGVLVNNAWAHPTPAAIATAFDYANGPLAKPVNQNILRVKNALLTLLIYPAGAVNGSIVPKEGSAQLTSGQRVSDYFFSGTDTTAAWNNAGGAVLGNPSLAGTSANFQLEQNIINAIQKDSSGNYTADFHGIAWANLGGPVGTGITDFSASTPTDVFGVNGLSLIADPMGTGTATYTINDEESGQALVSQASNSILSTSTYWAALSGNVQSVQSFKDSANKAILYTANEFNVSIANSSN